MRRENESASRETGEQAVPNAPDRTYRVAVAARIRRIRSHARPSAGTLRFSGAESARRRGRVMPVAHPDSRRRRALGSSATRSWRAHTGHGRRRRREQILTELPGPKSRDLHTRRQAAVSSGLTTGFPVYIERAEGAILVDVDGNQLVDLGSGIAVTSVGHAVPDGRRRGSDQASRVHPHLLHGHALRGLRGGLRGAQPRSRRATTTSAARCSTRAPRPSRTPSRSRGSRRAARPSSSSSTPTTAARTSRWRSPRRTCRTRTASAPSPPRSTACRRATRSATALDGAGGGGARDRPDRDRRRRAQRRGRAHRAHPGRGRLRRPGGGLPPRARRRGARRTARSSSPTRSRPGSAAPGAWFASEHEGVVPDLVATAKGIAAGLPLAAVTGRAEPSWTPCTRAGSAAPTAGTPSPARRRSPRSRSCDATTSRARARWIERRRAPAPRRARGRDARDRRGPRPRRDARASSSSSPARPTPEPRGGEGRRSPRATPRGCVVDLVRHLRQRGAPPAARSRSPRRCSTTGCRSSSPRSAAG